MSPGFTFPGLPDAPAPHIYSMLLRLDSMPAAGEYTGGDLWTCARSWTMVLPDVTPKELRAAIWAHIQYGSGDWPVPGQMRRLIPRRVIHDMTDRGDLVLGVA